MNNDSRSFEDELAAVKAELAVMRSNCATKAELDTLRTELTEKIQSSPTGTIGRRSGEVGRGINYFIAEMYKAMYEQTWKIIATLVAVVVVICMVARAGY
jgi:hypothetical protein